MNAMPDRVARLDRDKRGYPIPWNVLRNDNGFPFFTVNDDRRGWLALRGELCPICGERLGRFRYYVGGPLSAFHPNGWFLDLPGHYDCIRFALQTCPYIAAPKYLGRVDVVHAEQLPPEARVLLDDTQIPERPEVFVALAGSRVEIGEPRGPGGALIPYTRPRPPYLGIEYWRHGRRLSEIEAMPFLRAALGDDWKPPAVKENESWTTNKLNAPAGI
jgi:hypothetical protein